MDTNETGHIISHAEWEQWQAMKSSYLALQSEAEERKRVLQHLQTAVREAAEKHTRYRAETGDELIRLTQAHANQRDCARRSAAGLVIALKALDELVKALTASNMEDAQRFFPGEVFRAIQEASDVIRAHGFPF